MPIKPGSLPGSNSTSRSMSLDARTAPVSTDPNNDNRRIWCCVQNRANTSGSMGKCFVMVFTSSDLMAVGAATVLERAKRPDVIVIGFDGIAEGTDLVIAGKAAGDVAQNAKAMGEISVEIAMQIIKGEKKASDFPKVIDSGMMLVHRWNVQKYRADFLGIK